MFNYATLALLQGSNYNLQIHGYDQDSLIDDTRNPLPGEAGEAANWLTSVEAIISSGANTVYNIQNSIHDSIETANGQSWDAIVFDRNFVASPFFNDWNISPVGYNVTGTTSVILAVSRTYGVPVVQLETDDTNTRTTETQIQNLAQAIADAFGE